MTTLKDIALSMLLLAVPATAQQTADIGHCSDKAVIGVWEKYDMFPGTEDLTGANKYQAYRFFANGTFSRIASNEPLGRKLLATFAGANVVTRDTYDVDQNGIMSMRFPAINTPDAASCALTKKATETKLRGRVVRHGKGDMVLTYFDRAARPRFQLYLKRVVTSR